MVGNRKYSGIGRREFISTVPGMAAAVAAAPGVVGSAAGSSAELKAGQVRDYLMGLDGGWVKRKETVDTFKSGSADSVVRAIAVGWMS